MQCRVLDFFMNKNKNLNDLQNELCDLAIQISNYYKIKLDFSNNSIKNVEKILSIIHKDYKKTKNDEGLNGIALEFGIYIIKVIEKNFEKGKLERDHKDFGENTFPYYLKDSVIFPYGWCQKRIFDGTGDNVWIKYQTLVLNKT
jgi:hypothetical protein